MTRVAVREEGNLRTDLPGFVGRREATAQVRRKLSEARVLTLTGVGGVGKTRLARHVAWESRRAFHDGVWLVDLAKLDDPLLLDHVVAATLGLQETAIREPLRALVEYLQDRQLLLVLDNCEHVLDASARLVAELLRTAPDIRVLATSREPLRIVGEHVWPVIPLSVPPQDALDPGAGHDRRYEAIDLFWQRAESVLPGVAKDRSNDRAVARICHLLEGLPLAIELAAAQLRRMSIGQLLAQLDDRYRVLADDHTTSRHATLDAAMGWSYELCSPPERVLWARLSVFAGGFDLGAAAMVCTDASLPADDLLSVLGGLSDKSILTLDQDAPEARYRMLETIREYGRSRLGDGESDTLRRRHRDHYLDLAERVESAWFGEAQLDLARNLRSEYANLTVALEYCLSEHGENRSGLRLAGALWPYWIPCGFLLDGRSWLDRALQLDTTPCRERAQALWACGYVATRQGDIATALDMLDSCRALGRELGEEDIAAHANSAAGLTLQFADDLPSAVARLEEAIAYYRTEHARPDTPLILALFFLAYAMCLRGNTERAVALCEEGGRICRTHDERWALSWTLWGLGLAHWIAGNIEDAIAQLRESLLIKHAFHDLAGTLLSAECLAWTLATPGDTAMAVRAARLLGAVHARWKPIGTFLYGHKAFLDWRERCEARLRALLGDQPYENEYRRGSLLTVDAVVSCATGEKKRGARAAHDQDDQKTLSSRERDVAKLVADGLSNREIAAQLVIAERTAESHIDHIFTKLGFTSRTQIAAWVGQDSSFEPNAADDTGR
ncbi:LuxR C-terminal-related transcriptional regulator [Actinopolymorpha sp. B9G3]|uniref:ATP-binding protein n=1 Tax=Actinopolymorpha sp. B9G3 TaxID=3158970 RepID=UPI0032D8CDC2